MLKEYGVKLGVLAGIWLLSTTSTFAEEIPSDGIVYNTKEASSIMYHCRKNQDNTLDCDFTQSSVRKKVNSNDLETRLDQAKKAFTSEKFTPEQCKNVKNFIDELQGRKKALNKEAEDHLRNISELEKKDLHRSLAAMESACESKTEESYLNIIRVGFEKDARTCLVSPNSYRQSFKLVLDDLSGERSWVATGEPFGACGIIQLSRFEPEQLKDSNLVFWKYVAKKAVTNKKGLVNVFGMACKDLDENEYIYDWRQKEHALGCDYIEFSPM